MVLPMSALLTGASLDKAGLKIRPGGRHEIHGVGAVEAAMHALALLQPGVGDGDGAHHRLLAAGRIRAEIDDDRRARRDRRALQVDRRKRQRARERAELVIDEQSADVVLREQSLRRRAAVSARSLPGR